MISIFFEGEEYPNYLVEKSYSIFLNQSKPILHTPVRKIIASGNDLNCIRHRLDNIPIAAAGFGNFETKTTIWRDDLAQFIYDNL